MKFDFSSIFQEKIKFALNTLAKLAQRVLNKFSLTRFKDFGLQAATKSRPKNLRFPQKKLGSPNFPQQIPKIAIESHSSTDHCPINSNKAGFISEKPIDSVALGVIYTIYSGFKLELAHAYRDSDFQEGNNTSAGNMLPASLTPKFFFVISNERLVRLIFEFKLEGSRGVYELPTPKGDVVNVWYSRHLPPAVILNLNSNRYRFCSFLPLLFDELKETGGFYYGDFYSKGAGRIRDPCCGRDFVLAFCPAVVEFEAASKPIIREGEINSPGLLSLAKYKIEIGETVRIFEFHYSSGWGKPRLFCKSR